MGFWLTWNRVVYHFEYGKILRGNYPWKSCTGGDMPTIIIDGVEYCLELSPDEDNGDEANKPSISNTGVEVTSHYK